ncbi:glycosyltransferase family 34 protein, partial [Tortispora caseinolytica NRRL Y-17796]
EAPQVIIVTALDTERYNNDHLSKVVQNRKDYAEHHGYGLYIRYITDFENTLDSSPSVWAKVPMMRAAIAQYPNAKYFWYLDEDALIMDEQKDIYDHILKPEALEKVIRRNAPLVPVEYGINTHQFTSVDTIRLIIAQSVTGMLTSSFVLVNDDFASYFLDIWFDRLYRSHSDFANSESRTLSHILLWHRTVLERTALVSTKALASLSQSFAPYDLYTEGDFVLSLEGCLGRESCLEEFDKYWTLLEQS